MIKNRNIQWMLAAILMTGMTLMTSCSDDDSNSSNKNGDNESALVEPTTDQLNVRVTADLPAASLSQFAEASTGAALIKRLPLVTASIEQNTELVLLKGSDVNTLTDQMVSEMARVMYYDGYVALETPTEQQVELFFNKILKGMAAIVTDSIDDIFDLTPQQVQATVKASMVGRMETRQANLTPYTRAAGDDNSSCAELIIFGAEDLFYLDPISSGKMANTYATDVNGNLLEEEKTITMDGWNATAYHYGLYADGAAQWINNIEAEKAAEEEQENNASRRADGSKAINDLQSASETFTHSGNIFYKTSDNQLSFKASACQNILRSWGVHNMSNNKDYYYIRQQVLLSLGKSDEPDLFYGRGHDKDWWKSTYNFNKYNLMYGSFLTSYKTSMNLTGSGNIKGEAATPETANQVTTQSVNLTTTSSSTSSAGFSVGGTFGLTSKGITANATIGGSASTGKSQGNSFAMGNSKSIKGLEVVKNTAGTKVTWIYTGKIPAVTGQPDKWQHEDVAEILVNDANLNNDICWSVDDPSGRYTLEVESQPEMGMLLIVNGTNEKKVDYTETKMETYSHQLLMPNRYQQIWRMFLVVDEWDMQGYSPKLQTQLEDDFKISFSDIYADTFTIVESYENSVILINEIIKHAMNVFDSHKDVLVGLAQGNGVKKFTIHWRCDNAKIKTRGGYPVKVD